MYLKYIGIKNVGPVKEISINLPFNDSGNPKPILFVGENGSGKTILLAHIIDALYEIACQIYTNVGNNNGLARYLYKINGGGLLKSGSAEGFSILQFETFTNKLIEYYDTMGNTSSINFKTLNQQFSLGMNEQPKSITQIEHLQKEIEIEWNNNIHLYQPAHRFEEPFWKNSEALYNNKVLEQKKYSRQLSKELEIISSLNENKSYIMDLVMDFTINGQNMPDRLNWDNINQMLRSIRKNNNIRFGIGHRSSSSRIGIVEIDNSGTMTKEHIPSIDNLSLGELVLLNLFINIIRHGDTPPKMLSQMKGIVIIDEIDIHLHTDLQNSILPQLIKKFPAVQFIITTHSPLFILGMEREFGTDGFDIINMPSGEKISTERFSEFQNAYEVLANTKKHEEEINRKIKESSKYIVCVEGDYDIKYFTTACNLFNRTDILEKIEFINAEGCGNLKNIWDHKSNLWNALGKVLLIYDCDTKVQDSEKNNLVKRIITFQENHYFERGIENLFPKTFIDNAITHKPAFVDITNETIQIKRGEVITIPKKYEINKDEKGNLCNWICGNGTKDDFEKFDLVISILDEFIGKCENDSKH